MTNSQFIPNVSIEPLGGSATKVWLGDKIILFSYKAPIALWVLAEDGQRGYVTQERYSATTARHIREFGPYTATVVSAAELARLIAGEGE